MLFKNPALLYGLFFLLIPILVHLFQLRRFKKVAFTNVAFLKPLINQTRKSRQLKKWLSLLARMLAISCLVLAFAQPYWPGSDTATSEKETLIYLDNSYSMQAKGAKSTLYNTAVTDLLRFLSPDKVFSLFTNDQVFTATNKQQLSNALLNSGFTGSALTPEQIQLKAQSLFNNDAAVKELILISDFQKNGSGSFTDSLPGIKLEFVKLEPQNLNNISIDTVFVASQNGRKLKLEVDLSANYEVETPITISLDNAGILMAKTSVKLENQEGTAEFDLELTEPLQASVSIEDEGLTFDNSMYISTNNLQKIKVLSVNGANGNFLNRLYDGPEFEYLAVNERDLNYNLVASQQLVILNELTDIPAGLRLELNKLMANGGSLVIIPSLQMSELEIAGIPTLQPNDFEKRITQIHFSHPLLEGVFNNRVTNFQYPRINTSLLTTNALSPILSLEDGSSFLFQKGKMYIFTAPINQENSNFQNSPLIVPIFYNMAISALPVPELYYSLGTDNQIAVPAIMEQDEVLKLELDSQEWIPAQQAFDSYVMLSSGQELKLPGSYNVLQSDKKMATLSYNLDRSENKMTYYQDADLGPDVFNEVSDVLDKISQEENILSLWKYFVLGALFFLICELLILKYLK
ncbi:BatA domain-containing protein [Nonlabens xiamenensis]|uniref:BatA domain-containing protein n=1 Tax=Nonlabens xiamenensis TaxID=2341043 RepID=UPI000F60F835|nr:BatA domain-containing protein [Nonlabens xiamenensis]